MKSDERLLHQMLVVQLLAITLLLSGTGQVLCFGANGQSVIEPVTLLTECAPNRCGSTDSFEVSILAEETGCVDLFLPGLLTIRAQRFDGETCTLDLRPLCCTIPDFIETDHSVDLNQWLSQTGPPNLREIRSLQSVILLI